MDIEFDVEEIKDKSIFITGKKENLLNELISFFKAYGDDILIFEISEMVNQIMNMYNTYDDLPFDKSDTLSFIKNINLQKHFTLPRWLIPIVDNKKRIYVDKEQDDIESNNNTNVKHFEDELIEKNTLISV